jgi:hypothetical protein
VIKLVQKLKQGPQARGAPGAAVFRACVVSGFTASGPNAAGDAARTTTGTAVQLAQCMLFSGSVLGTPRTSLLLTSRYRELGPYIYITVTVHPGRPKRNLVSLDASRPRGAMLSHTISGAGPGNLLPRLPRETAGARNGARKGVHR